MGFKNKKEMELAANNVWIVRIETARPNIKVCKHYTLSFIKKGTTEM